MSAVLAEASPKTIPRSTRHFYRNREACLARNRAWHAANRERVKEKNKRYHQEHREEIAARKKRNAEANPEAMKTSQRKYSQRHPEAIRAKSHVRRARLKAGGKYSVRDWFALCEKYGDRCLACGVIPDLLTVDHIRPVSKGGPNTIENLQPLCGACNYRKGKREIDYRPVFFKGE